MSIQTPDYIITGLDRFYFDTKIAALRALVERALYIKSFHWLLTAADVTKEYAEFRAYFDEAYLHEANEIRRWFRGVILFGFEQDKHPFQITTRDVLTVLPRALQIINQLERMGRFWEYDPETGISQEYLDFMLLLDLHEAGETVLIEIED